MGLDMYLTGEHYLWRHTEKPDYNKIRKAVAKASHFEADEVRSIKVELGYWRKANQIHRWFVENIQDGEDNCRPYYVEPTDLEKLKKVCQKVISRSENFKEDWHKIAHIDLPVGEGFFFGNYDYDEYYIKQLKETVKMITKILKHPMLEELDITYQSSW